MDHLKVQGGVSRLPAALSACSSLSGRLRVQQRSEDSVRLAWASGAYGARLWRFPFRLEILCGDDVVVTFNSRGQLWFEPLQEPSEAAGKGNRWFKAEETELVWV